MEHTHYFPDIRELEGEDFIAYGMCACGLTKYFVNYYGDIKRGVTLRSVKQRVADLNEGIMTGAVVISRPKLSPVPPKPNGHNWIAIHAYYNAYAAAILQDKEKIGRVLTMQRWGMSPSTLHRFCATHSGTSQVSSPTSIVEANTKSKTSIVEAKVSSLTSIVEANTKSRTSKMDNRTRKVAKQSRKMPYRSRQMSVDYYIRRYFPDLPRFNKRWPPSVQAAWLQTYGLLVQAVDAVHQVRKMVV